MPASLVPLLVLLGSAPAAPTCSARTAAPCKKACLAGSLEACGALVELAEDRKLTGRELAGIDAPLRKACAADERQACYQLGLLSLWGAGVAEDHAAAAD